MESVQKKKIFLIALAVLLAVLLILGAVVLALESGGPGGGTTFSGVEVPDNELLVDDLYEGETLIPKFDYPANNYETEKFQEENGIITYQSPNARLGVDVSEYQGNIDWHAVKTFGVDFAILRVGYRGLTQGMLYKDAKFDQNFDSATSAGLFVGAYFFSQAVTEAEAVAEADFVIEALDGRKLAYPVIFDWELPNSGDHQENLRARGVTGEDATRFAIAFCERIKEAGLTPVIYTNKYQAYEFFDLSQWKDYDLWYAEYQKAPSMHYDFRLWQYTDKGEVPGIEGGVDLDICFKPY